MFVVPSLRLSIVSQRIISTNRDYRYGQYLDAYKQCGVFAPEVTEVENPLLIEQVLLAVTRKLCLPGPRAAVEEVKAFKAWVISEFDRLKHLLG